MEHGHTRAFIGLTKVAQLPMAMQHIETNVSNFGRWLELSL
jgi:hypothetical protein